jgi:hypothetical protein
MNGERVSLTWRMWQGGVWRTTSAILPASSAARVGVALLREFSPSKTPWQPSDLDMTQRKTSRFSYESSEMVLRLRLLGHARG